MKAMVLAAGKGVRLKQIAGGKPKVLTLVCGKTLLERNLRYLKHYGVKELVINLHAFSSQITAFLKKNKNFGLRIRYSKEKTLMGTAGGVRKARRFFRDKDFLVLYGDNLLDYDIRCFLRAHKDQSALVTLGVYRPGETKWSGIAAGLLRVNRQGIVDCFSEKRNNAKIPKGWWVSAGIFICSPGIFNYIPSGKKSDFGRDIFPKLLADGREIHTFRGARYVLASDTPKLWKKTNRVLKQLQPKGE